MSIVPLSTAVDKHNNRTSGLRSAWTCSSSLSFFISKPDGRDLILYRRLSGAANERGRMHFGLGLGIASKQQLPFRCYNVHFAGRESHAFKELLLARKSQHSLRLWTFSSRSKHAQPSHGSGFVDSSKYKV